MILATEQPVKRREAWRLAIVWTPSAARLGGLPLTLDRARQPFRAGGRSRPLSESQFHYPSVRVTEVNHESFGRELRGHRKSTSSSALGLWSRNLNVGSDVRVAAFFVDRIHRSEERRVGKECRSRWS